MEGDVDLASFYLFFLPPVKVVVTGSVRAARPSRPKAGMASAGSRAPRFKPPPPAAVVEAGAPYDGAAYDGAP